MFCNLHVHDAKGSLLDSILTVQDIVKFAKENDQTAIALTNHGYMTSYVDFVKECNKQGVKPIIGNEVYEVDDMTVKANTKDSREKRYHLILLAKNSVGYHNLIKITSVSCTEGFYGKPRIDLSYIQEHNLGEGIICLTACQAGRLSRLLVGDRFKEAEMYYKQLTDIFDNVYCEIQSHSTESQIYANDKIIQFAQKHNYEMVVTTDAHMLDNTYLDAHSVFVRIAEDREVGELYQDCCLQTEEQVIEIMSQSHNKAVVQRAIANTQVIADMIEDIDIGLGTKAIMPKIKVEEGFESNQEYLRHLVFATFDEKFGHMSETEQQIRRDRIETELKVLYVVDYTDYFIMLYMLAQEARHRNIPLGYSRGSGANCLCLFMLNVTQIDSVRWRLDFSRFANLGRKSPPDYDFDISKRHRKEMVKIAEDLFGKENVAPIATFNTLSTKVAIRDTGKVLNEDKDSPYYGQIPYAMRDEVAKMIPTIKTLNDLGEEEEKEALLKDILSKNEKLNSIYNRFPLWFKYVMTIEGLPKSMGRHAAGTLITPKPIIDYCPLCYDSEKNIMIQLEMHNAMDDLCLQKADFLGLESIDTIDDTLKLAGLTWQDVDINHLDLADKEVYNNIYKTGNTIGVFQMESAEARKMCIDAKADNIEDIIVANAANRPGTKDSFPTYCKNKLFPDKAELVHDDLRPIFQRTQGVLLYQEQALQIFRYAGFPEEEVDNARRCVDEHTWIMLRNGDFKEIKDVAVGEQVMCLNEDINKIEYKTVVSKFDNGVKDTYSVRLNQSEELIATANHKVLTQDGWKEISDLNIDDYIMKPKCLHAYKDNIPANKKPHFEIMFLFGLLIGDGCLGDKNDIHFTNSEETLIDKFKSCVGHLLPRNKNCEFYINKQNGVSVDYVYSIKVKSKNFKNKLIEQCEKYDLLHKASDKNVTRFMDYPPNKLIQGLLAGLYNTDGGYNLQSVTIEYYTKSKLLAYQISSLMLKFKIRSYVYSKNVQGYNYKCYVVVIKDSNSISIFSDTINKYVVGRKHNDYDKICQLSKNKRYGCDYNYILPQKYAEEIRTSVNNHDCLYTDLSRKISNGDYEIKVTHSGITDVKASNIIQNIYCPNTYRLLTAEYYPVKIKSIEYHGVSHVYDLEVESNHNYIANNLIVHNCIGKKQKDKMAELETKFREGLTNKEWTKEQQDEIWNLMLKQASYSFNAGHQPKIVCPATVM